MRFAFLGDDPAALPLVRAIVARGDHALTQTYLAEALLAELLSVSPRTRTGDRWDELLVARELDAVIVAGARQDVLDAAKQVAGAGVPLVVVADARQGSQWVYELTLIRDDTRVPLLPVFPQFAPQAANRLREACDGGAIGRIRHIQMEREWVAPVGRIPNSSGQETSKDGLEIRPSVPLLSPGDVERALLPDAAFLRMLGGDYGQVTAIHSGASEGRLSLATVTLAGNGLPEALWTLRPASAAGSARLEVVGEAGHAILTAPDEGAETLEINGIRVELPESVAESESETIARIERALRGERVLPDWTDLTRTFEIVDAARRSVRRRRTIDLHFETQSERSLFKTQMTAIGCGLLVFTFLATVGVLLVGALLPVDKGVLRIARIAVFAPLFAYLALQALLFLSRPPLAAREHAGKSEVP